MPSVDPPSARLRREGSTPRRRSSDPAPRRREEDHKPANSSFGAFFTVLVAVLFLGYVFNVAGFASTADQLFAHLNESAQSENDLVVHWVALLFPALALVLAAVLVFGLLTMLMNSFRRSSKRRRLAGRQVMSLETFKRITGQQGIRPRIAAQAYDLMLPFYNSTMRARLDDRLVEDLQLTPGQVQDLYANLLRNTDRKAPAGDPPEILTVMDLLNAAQGATRQSLMDSMARPLARLSGIKKAHRRQKSDQGVFPANEDGKRDSAHQSHTQGV